MSVITISGQAGAGDELVAGRVAEALGYRLIDRPVVLKVLEQYGIVDYEKLLDTPPHLFDGLGSEKQSANDLLNRLYLLFARRNNVVIVSRRAYISLEPFLNSFAVFLKAPQNARVRNVMRWEELSQTDAQKAVVKEEERRRGIIESFHKRHWDSMTSWTLVADTHKLGIDRVVEMIISANEVIARADELFGWQDGLPTTDTIETDPVMETAVDKVLETAAPATA